MTTNSSMNPTTHASDHASDIKTQRLGNLSSTLADIQFCDNYIPALTADTYTITMTHQISGDAELPPSPPQPFTETQQFLVEGPRFSITAADIQTQFPANKSQRQFDQQFPYIVLTKRALPWERLLQPSDNTIPWVALLLFQESELIAPAGNSGTLSNPTGAGTYSLSQIVQPEAGVLGPAIQLSVVDDPQATCRAINLSPATFTALLPRLGELKYLTHVRQIDQQSLQGKCESELTGTGWFSVVMANRLPIAPPAGSSAAVRNIAHLVSLEGFQSYLTDSPSFPSGITSIRLVSLASWTFDCLAESKEDFSALMLNLVAQAKNNPQALALTLPAALPANPTPDQQLAQTILSHGYVPLQYNTRAGDQTYSWYRGPLTPLPITAYPSSAAYSAAEAALVYDANTGLFDQSYAVAWQTGRMLALADRSFAVSVLNWRRQTNQALHLLRQRLHSPHVPAALKQTDTVEQIRQLLHPHLIRDSFMQYLGEDFAAQVAPRVATLGIEDHPLPLPKEQSPAAPALADLRQWMQQPETAGIFQRTLLALRQIQGDAVGNAVGDSPADTVPADILTWLTRLALLYGVPFDTLVPNPQMLPPESIRFFYVDPNAINSLIDGALSLGVHSSQQQVFNEFARDTIRQAVHQSLPMIRSRLLGAAMDASNGSNSVTVTQPVAGFLLRSQAVSALPGLEINCYQFSNGQAPATLILPLRIDRLTKDVLLCLLPTVPAWIEFSEPKESFGFGVEVVQSTLQIDLRTVTGSQPGSIIQPEVSQPIPFRGTSTVVDIGALQTAIQQKLQGQLNHPNGMISPAEFAIQLMQAPEKMVFQNPTQSPTQSLAQNFA